MSGAIAVDAAEQIGVIGLGVMGRPVARRILNAGLPVLVYSRRPGSTAELETLGAESAPSVGDLARQSSIIITLLPATSDVEDVVLRADGVLASAARGSLLIDMSTIAPATSREIAARGAQCGIDVVDAPVSGGESGAINGTLSVMCGGNQDAVDRARHVFDHISGQVVHAGGPGAGQVVKACNQVMVALSLQAMGEALVLGAKAGVAPESIVSALSGGAARCWALEQRSGSVLKGDFSPGFRSRLHHKDLRIALELADQLGVTLPAASVAKQMFAAMEAQGLGDLDHSAVIKIVEELSGFSLPVEDSKLGAT